jgi:flagellar hook-length control protein FliK
MHPLPSTPGDFLAPAPSGNQPTGSPPVGEESFSKHLANETARESTGDTESALSYGREMAGNAPLLNQIVAEAEPQLRIVPNSAASTTDPIVEIQQPQLVNVPGEKNKNASPLMVLLDKLSAQQITPHSLTGNAESSSPSIATVKSVVPAEVIGQQKQPSALQQQLTALSEILTPVEPATSALQPSSLKTDVPHFIQQGAQNAIPGTVQLMPGNQGPPSVTVEQWSATFKPVQAQPVHTENTAVVSPTPLGENVIKTESGQTITIYQSSDNEEMAVATPLAARPSIVDQSGQRQDANSNYLHSNLPNNTAKAALGAEGDQQAKNGGEQQPDPKNLSTASELGTEPRLSRETAPVTFTLDGLVPTISTPTSPSTPPGAGLMKLPSGATFPESAVVDQVINHFSGARKLESGSIRLQLHPQELGELRMEIEVKQNNVKAHITAQNPQAQEALDRHLPRLRETLAQQGLHLNEVEITVAAGDQSDGNHFQQNSARHQLGKSYRLGNIPTTGIAPIAGEESSPVNESKQGVSVTV